MPSTGKNELLIDIPLIKVAQTEFKENTPSENIDYSKMVSVQLETLRKEVGQDPAEQEIPLMVSLVSKDHQVENKRVGLDIVMTIDISSSMSGQKIKFVVETLLFIIDEMKETDRLSLVIFNDKSEVLTNLTPMTKEAKERFKKTVISRVKASGTTNIKKGLSDSFSVLLNRRQINDVSAVFLLSDGQDTCGNNFKDIENCLQTHNSEMIKKGMNFKINSFGYGEDHDEKVLAMISSSQNGQFYYIKSIEIVDECFIDCLGLLMSIFAKQAEITLFMNGQAQIKKKYGLAFDSESNPVKAVLKIGNISAGQEKNFICDLKVPPTQSLDQLKVCSAILTFVSNGQNFIIEQNLTLPIVGKEFLSDASAKVEQHMIRVQAAETLKEAEEDRKKGNVKLAKEKIRCKKAQMKSDFKAERFMGVDDIFDEAVIDNPKDMMENMEIFEMQAYRPKKFNFSAQNSMQKEMVMKKKR